jgi:hypothetical protein
MVAFITKLAAMTDAEIPAEKQRPPAFAERIALFEKHAARAIALNQEAAPGQEITPSRAGTYPGGLDAPGSYKRRYWPPCDKTFN